MWIKKRMNFEELELRKSSRYECKSLHGFTEHAKDIAEKQISWFLGGQVGFFFLNWLILHEMTLSHDNSAAQIKHDVSFKTETRLCFSHQETFIGKCYMFDWTVTGSAQWKPGQGIDCRTGRTWRVGMGRDGAGGLKRSSRVSFPSQWLAGLLVQPRLGAGGVGDELLGLEPQINLHLGVLQSVTAVDDVPVGEREERIQK